MSEIPKVERKILKTALLNEKWHMLSKILLDFLVCMELGMHTSSHSVSPLSYFPDCVQKALKSYEFIEIKGELINGKAPSMDFYYYTKPCHINQAWVILIYSLHLTNQNESFKYKSLQINVEPLCTCSSDSWGKFSIPNNPVTSEKMEREELIRLKIYS